MNLTVRQLNIDSARNNRGLKHLNSTAVSTPLNFNNNVQNPQNSEVSFGGLNNILRNLGNKITKSAVEFNGYEAKKLRLDTLFGGELSKMEKELQEGWSASTFAHRIRHNSGGSITFVEDGILPKFFKSAVYPVKDLWLDLGNWALRGLEKWGPTNEFAKNALKAKPLANRANAKKLEEVFCIMQGAFADLAHDEKIADAAGKKATSVLNAGVAKAADEVSQEVDSVLENMLHATGSIKGNYKTADERTINRICTGLVSATMAGIDFYNISRMQNDDDTLAKKSQKKRFKQESSRIFMSAGMTFLTLGALSKYVNKNKYIALATISGTTLVSEILSRVMSGMPLRPLTPEEAKVFSVQQQNKKAKKQNGTKDAESQIREKQMASMFNDTPDVFSAFKKAPDTLFDKNSPDAKETKDAIKQKEETEFKGSSQNDAKKPKNDSPMNLKNILKAAGVLFASGMTVCFARSRSAKFNSLIKSAEHGLKEAFEMLTKKDFLVPEDEMTGFLEKFKSYGMKHYYEKFSGELSKIDKHKRVILKNAQGAETTYVNLGKIDKKGFSTIIKAVTYPITFIWNTVTFPVKIAKALFEKEGPKKVGKIEHEDLIGLYKTCKKAVDKELPEAEMEKFLKRTVIGIEDKTGKSAYKNTTLAAISRPIVTLIASYFFVNDYRNEVLITSQGKDVEGANAVAKERVMHKVSNFFFNALFMNLFNSVFETLYHGSLIGAGAVAAATEITNEHAIRASIGVPTRKMTKEQIEEHDRQNLTRDDFWGKYFRFMSKLTGKKTISQKVQDEEKKKAQKAQEDQK